jgi:hypothetical protein
LWLFDRRGRGARLGDELDDATLALLLAAEHGGSGERAAYAQFMATNAAAWSAAQIPDAIRARSCSIPLVVHGPNRGSPFEPSDVAREVLEPLSAGLGAQRP